MDLKELDTVTAANAGLEISLRHPATQEPIGMHITVMGRDSDAFREMQAQQNRGRLDRAVRAGSLKKGMLREQVDRDAIRLLAACTRSWRQDGVEGGTLTVDGVEVECTAAAAEDLYTKYPWVREQVDEAVMDRANFLQR